MPKGRLILFSTMRRVLTLPDPVDLDQIAVFSYLKGMVC